MKKHKFSSDNTSASMESMTDELLHCYEELGLIYETGELLASIARGEIGEWKNMSGNFLQIAIDTLKADLGWIFFVSDNEENIQIEAVKSIEKSRAEIISKQYLNQARKDPLMVNYPPDKKGNKPGDDSSLLIFSPFRSTHSFIGAIVIGKQSFPLFTSADVKLLSHVSGYFSNIFENARMFQEIKEAYRLSEEANVRLRELDKMKKDFIAITSHELNTPLSIMSLCLEMMKNMGREYLPEKLYGLLETMDESRARLADITNNICNYSLLNEGTLSPQKRYFQLLELTEEILNKLERIFKKRKIHLKIRIDKDFELFADKEMIKNLISEIVLNALKNTPDGGKIEITCKKKEGTAVVYISDNGHGIPDDEKKHLFDPFHKAGNFMTHSSGDFEYKTGGIGIGLALAKRIMEAHGGSIWLEDGRSVADGTHGCCFGISFPAK